MTRETKVGIGMVLLLVGVFGFLVYKRYTNPLEEEVVQNESQEVDGEGTDAPPQDDFDLKNDNPFPAENRQAEPEKILMVSGDERQIPEEESNKLGDPFGEPEKTTASRESTVSRPKLPTIVPEQDPFDNNHKEESSARDEETMEFADEPSNAREQPEESVASSGGPGLEQLDPFEDMSTAKKNVQPEEPSSFVAEEELVEEELDQDVAAEKTPATEIASDRDFPEKSEGEEQAFEFTPPMNESAKNDSRIPAEDETEIVTQRSQAEIPESTIEALEEEVAAEEDFTAPEMDARPVEKFEKTPAVELSFDESPSRKESDNDRFGGYEAVEFEESDAVASRDEFASPGVEESQVKPRLAGHHHVVQQGETFWYLSEKKYGTGRYFQALAAYNHAQVPDASKMKPGITITLPSEEELERRFPHLIPSTRRTEPEAAAGQTDQHGEFLTDAQGRPMYRIGARDTLSEIAQKYLGRSTRWTQIFEMNRDVLKDGNTLKVGAVLRLPADAAELQLSNQPRSFR